MKKFLKSLLISMTLVASMISETQAANLGDMELELPDGSVLSYSGGLVNFNAGVLIGNYDNTAETTYIGTLVPSDEGTMWYNSTSNELKYWDGTAAVVLSTGSGGANQSLSNLTSPTAINQDLLPDASVNNRDLGASGFRFNELFLSGNADILGQVIANGGTGEVFARYLRGPSGASMQILAGGASAAVDVATPAQGSGVTGNVSMTTGNNSGGASGSIWLTTGTATTTRGNATIDARVISLDADVEIDANTVKIVNLADPTAAQDAATKNYVDTQDAGKLGTALNSANIFVGNASNIATGVAMTGEASIDNTGTVTLSNAAVIAKVLTGYTPGAGTVSAADSILSAIQKLDGNIAALGTGPFIPVAGSSVITGDLTLAVSGSNNLGSSTNLWNTVFANTYITSGGASGRFGTGNATGATSTNSTTIRSGSVTGASATGLSGDTTLRSGDTVDGNTGIATVRSGEPTGAGASGGVVLRSGNTTGAGQTGVLTIKSGNASGSGNSGNVDISTGTVSSGTRGVITLTANGVTVDPGSVGMSLSSQKIVSLADPTANQDAATKKYVDDVAKIISSGSTVSVTDTVTTIDPGFTGNQWRKIVSVVGATAGATPNATTPIAGCSSGSDAYRELIVIGTSATNTVVLSTTGNLTLKATSTLGLRGTVHLVCDGTNWVEI